ncbi:MAG: metallophosphoesterase family protein [Clostridia bacterium]|nr:metallophosphoesterase family protein [Clostridia bacterium]
MNFLNYENDNNLLDNKIAIVADIHSNYYLFKRVMKDIKKEKIKTIVFLGDYITDGFENNKILNIIKKYNYIIAGNRELSIINYDGNSWDGVEQFKSMLYAFNDISKKNIDFLKKLPIYKIVTLNSKKICLSHITPFNKKDMVYANSFDIFDKLIDKYNCDIYLFAHTHEAYFTIYKGKMFINSGSVVLPADTPTSKYGILDLSSMTYEQKSISYDFNKLRNYYLNSDYFLNNKEWCNILIHTNETGIDYICSFIDFIKEKAMNDGIKIKDTIPNNLWRSAFLDFMKLNNLKIY